MAATRKIGPGWLSALWLSAGIAAGARAEQPVTAFGHLADGRPAHLFTLETPDGFRAEISDYGGRIVRLLVPDRSGHCANVVLGFDDVAIYEQRAPYVGALIGPVANRIANGHFRLDDRAVQLTRNEARADGASHHLHGGFTGFSRTVWHGAVENSEDGPVLRLTHRFPAGEEGYPGNRQVEVRYSLTRDHGLRIDFTAATDAPTPVSFASHAFFNLAGEGNGTIRAHRATIHASHYLRTDHALLPTGEIATVAGTPLDFRAPHPIGERLEAVADTGGYNHTYVFDVADETLRLQATVNDAASARVLEVLTTEPCVQFFTANLFDGTLVGLTGRPYPRHAGFCLETQRYVDAVNHPNFPAKILRPGETFHSTTIYRFSCN